MTEEAEKPHPNAAEFRQSRFSASVRLQEHLDQAIRQFSPPKESSPVMRGMNRLANLAPTIVAAIDAEADAVADQLIAQQGRAKEAIGKFRGFADAIGKTADDIEAALGQISNDPTQVSGA